MLAGMIDAITVTEFARRQGVTRAAVYQWMAKTPGLRPTHIGGLTLLTAEDQRRILARPKAKMGRPKKVLDTANPAA